jgi:hypothetical protein
MLKNTSLDQYLDFERAFRALREECDEEGHSFVGWHDSDECDMYYLQCSRCGEFYTLDHAVEYLRRGKS